MERPGSTQVCLHPVLRRIGCEGKGPRLNGKYEIGALGLAQSFEPTSLVKGGMAPRPKAPAPIGITRFAIPLLSLLIIVSASVAGAESSILDYPNPFDNPLHAPLGGGLDFPASVQRDKNHILVSTRDKLIAALEFVHGLDNLITLDQW